MRPCGKCYMDIIEHWPLSYQLRTQNLLKDFLPFIADILSLLPLRLPRQVLDDVWAAVQHQLASKLLFHLSDEGLEVVLGEQDAPSPGDHPLPPPRPPLDVCSLPLPTLLPIPRSKAVAPILSNLDCVHLERKHEIW